MGKKILTCIIVILLLSVGFVFFAFRTNYIFYTDVSRPMQPQNINKLTVATIIEDIKDQYGDYFEDPDAMPDGTTNDFNIAFPYTSLNNVKVKEDGKPVEEAYIYLLDGSNPITLQLYDGLPWPCTDRTHSYYIDNANLISYWKAFYKKTYGHDYPNKVHWNNNNMHHDYGDTGVSSYGATVVEKRASGSNTKYGATKYELHGVECMGVAVPNYFFTHVLDDGKFEAIGDDPYFQHKAAYVFTKDGNYYFAPAIPIDMKYHTWPGHALQTYTAYRNSGIYQWCVTGENSNSGTWEQALAAIESGAAGAAYGSEDWNVVQCSIEASADASKNSLNKFKFVGVIMYNDK